MKRDAVVAGLFYPGEPDRLREMVLSFGRRYDEPTEAKAVLVPHAGYVYSGAVAGEVFSSIRLPRRIIILAPNHTGRGAPLALAPPGTWYTPLGEIHVDEDANHRLVSEYPELEEDAAAHRYEHAIEVQLPFLQVLRPDFVFSAICIRRMDYDALEGLGHAIARAITSIPEPVLLVASSDMTHYESSEDAANQDRFAIDRLLAVDPAGLYKTVLEREITMCGFAPAVSVLAACRDVGAVSGRLIRYTNSGEASGDYERVVAYAGVIIQ